jgi:hypothetical protein
MYLIDCLFNNITCEKDSVIYINPSNVMISGFTSVVFKNCVTKGAKSAAISTSSVNPGNFSIKQCEFIDVVSEGINASSKFMRCNSIGSPYGALSFNLMTSGSGYVIVENCIFDSCIGAGNMAFNTITSGSILTVNDCIFKNYYNSDEDFEDDCIDIQEAEVTMKSCTFERFKFHGSMIYTNTTLKSLTLENCVFRSIHKINRNGGAIYGNIGNYGKLQITDCTFVDCSVPSEDGYGGAIYIDMIGSGTVKLNGTLIFKLNRTYLGWDIFIKGVFIYFNISFEIYYYFFF